MWPSLEKFITLLRRYALIGLGAGLPIGVITIVISNYIYIGFVGSIGGFSRENSDGIIAGLITAVGTIVVNLLLSIFDTPPVDERTTPAQGVRSSLSNGLLMTTLVGIVLGGLTWPLDSAIRGDGVLIVLILIWVLPVIFALYGGMAWCQHWALRFVLYWHSYLPFRLVPWLNSMVDAGILRWVGGGYIFIHRSLLEFFADMEGEKDRDWG